MGIGHYWRILVVSRENLHDFSLKVQYYSCEQIMTIPQEFFHERLQGPVGTFKLLNKM